MSYVLHLGDCREVMAGLEDCSVDAVVTDPPYELGMSALSSGTLASGISLISTDKHWDSSGVAYDEKVWAECLRVVKPGGYLLAFGATRTHHRMTCAVEDVGFEIRDCLIWCYGQGIPKSQNHLKGAWEPIVCGRKQPEKSITHTIATYGTGRLDIEGTRIPGGRDMAQVKGPISTRGRGWGSSPGKAYPTTLGRWPANILFSHTDECDGCPVEILGDAARFFYVTKPTTNERDKGLYGYEVQEVPRNRFSRSYDEDMKHPTLKKNVHTTVKPIELMQYLVRLVTPPRGTVLDPFTGSGTTGIACVNEGFDFVGIEKNEEYLGIAEARIKYAVATKEESLFDVI